MISKATFDAIQVARVNVSKPRKKRGDKGLQFLNFAACGSCGYCITGERHTKKSGLRFYYYRCTHRNKKVHCEDRSFVRQENFAQEIKRNAELLTLPEIWKERFLAKVETWEGQEFATKQQEIDRLKGVLTGVKEKIARLNTAFTEGGLGIDEFKELKNALIPEKTNLEAASSLGEK